MIGTAALQICLALLVPGGIQDKLRECCSDVVLENRIMHAIWMVQYLCN